MTVMFSKVGSMDGSELRIFDNVYRVSVFLDTWELFMDHDFGVVKQKDYNLVYCAESGGF